MNIRQFWLGTGIFLMLISGCKNGGEAGKAAQSGVQATDEQASSDSFAAALVPSINSCSFYLAEEQKHKCVHAANDGSNYLTHFGYNYCRAFLESTLEKESEPLAHFLPAVRLCLQVKQADFYKSGSCREMDRLSTESHFGCYIDSGFCSVPLVDQLKIAKVIIGFDIIPRIIESAELFAKIAEACQSDGMRLVSASENKFAKLGDSLSNKDLQDMETILDKMPMDPGGSKSYLRKFLDSWKRPGAAADSGATDGQGLALTADMPEQTEAELRATIKAFLNTL